MSKLGELKEILKKLIAIPSVTGNEHDIAIYIADYLRQCGVDSVELQPVEGKRLNVVAHLKGEKAGPVVLLTGHMDTVAPGEGWRTDPFKATERDGRIYGRGAADMKGGIAAILVAIRNAAAQREQMRGEAIIAFVCDEEAYSKGVDALIRSGIRADYGIAAEPEWDAVIGAVGKMLIKVRVYGIVAHGSQPEKGINAVEEGAKFLAALDRLPLGQHPKLGCQQYVTLKMEGGFKEYGVVVPEYCEILINKHTVPSETQETVLRDMRELVERLGLRARFEFELQQPYYDAFDLAPDLKPFERVKNIFEEVTGRKMKSAYCSGVSDNNRWVIDAGIPVICLGPHGEGYHQKDEWVELKTVEQMSEIYQRLLMET